MKSCDFHLNVNAEYYCRSCNDRYCEKCVAPSYIGEEATCLKCNQQLYVLDISDNKTVIKNKLKSKFNSNIQAVEKTPVELCLATVNMYVVEGDFNQAVSIFDQFISQHPNDYWLKAKYFDFLVATQAREKLENFGSVYLSLLIKTHRKEKLYSAYKNILDIVGDFEIIQLHNKIQIARACYEKGNYKQSVLILQNVRFEHPRDVQLIEAYQVMHDAFIFIPGQEKAGMRVREIMKELIAKQKAGSALVDDSEIPNPFKDSLGSRKRINVHENRKIYETLNKTEFPDHFEETIRNIDKKSVLQLDDEEPDTQSKYSNYGSVEEKEDASISDFLTLDEDIDYKGFNQSDSQVSTNLDVSNNSTIIDDEIMEEEIDELLVVPTLEVDEDLTLDDSDSITSEKKKAIQKNKVELKKKPKTTSNAIEFTDKKANSKETDNQSQDEFGAINFD